MSYVIMEFISISSYDGGDYLFKRENQVSMGWWWIGALFMVLILGCNHFYGYSLLDSFLNYIGIGSWTNHDDQVRWHITSFFTVPLILISMIQSTRHLKKKFPRIFMTLFISTMVWSAVYPDLTEWIVNSSQVLIR